MGAIITLTKWLDLVPALIELGVSAVDTYNQIERVWAQNRVPGDAEWDAFKVRLDAARATLHDTSRDV